MGEVTKNRSELKNSVKIDWTALVEQGCFGAITVGLMKSADILSTTENLVFEQSDFSVLKEDLELPKFSEMPSLFNFLESMTQLNLQFDVERRTQAALLHPTTEKVSLFIY